MSILNLLIELAATTPYQTELKNLIANQSNEIQYAFHCHNADFLKQQLMLNHHDVLINERTVVQH